MCGDGFRRLLICRLRPVREPSGLELGIPDCLRHPVLREPLLLGSDRGVLLRLRHLTEGDRPVLDRVGRIPKLPCQVAGSELVPAGRLCSLPGRECPAVDDDVLRLDCLDVGEDLLLLLFERLDLVLDLFGRLAGEIARVSRSTALYSSCALVASFVDAISGRRTAPSVVTPMMASPIGFAAIAALNPRVATVAAIVEA